MGKKDKKKGKGAEKTAAKTDKKLSQKMKKELAVKGEDEIDKIIAQINEEERKQKEVVIKSVSSPSCRSNFSFTAHPEKDELILFGGEYFNGQKTFLYNEMFIYNINRGDWTMLKAPAGPPPRCSHQAVALPIGGGQLWVYGGEFASPTQSQFYHYRDLWVFHFATHLWEQVNAPGAPSSRSGHRMICVKKQLFVFGGFHDNLREYKYFNDVYSLNLETRTWTKIEPVGTPPAPRSACQMVATPDGKILVFGGYSKVRVKKVEDKGTIHMDAFLLGPDKHDSTGQKWKWSQVKLGGAKYSPRCGVALTGAPGSKAYTFGGVFDVENDEDDDIDSEFYNDLHCLDLEKLVFRTVALSGKKEGSKPKRRRRKENDKEEEGDEDGSEGEMEIEDKPVETPEVQKVSDDGVFTMTVGPALTSSDANTSAVAENSGATPTHPRPRMNCGLAVKHGTLYMYGGLFEQGERTFTLSDLHALDLHKLDEWRTLVTCDVASQEWLASSSESEESCSDDDDDSEEDEEMDTD
ncbi:kelch domain-containing protein 4-like [Macrosteles quadrilineatus]|uniref:kelch domain-containing protein 4-like n=1 Tax=Macrosteles quadrilineatus TaxID=74068 RepID=UPI0023E17D80|nr:kelch domain-containing protein 4-like [Macrosteles quadrilineatus]